MRSIFIALVVINLGVFIAQWLLRDTTVAAVPQAARPLAQQSPSLRLLSEDDSASAAKKIAPDQSINAAPSGLLAADDASAMCTMVGPFIQLLHAEYLQERLHAMEADAKIHSIEVPDGLGYWVYLSPEVSEKEALRRLYELQAKEIDSYIIPNGELANGISLGIFNERSAADMRINEIREQGYRAELREVTRTVSETWVVMPIAEAEKIDPEIWIDLLRQQSGLEKRQNYCLGVAPN